MQTSSKIFFTIFFLAISASVGMTYYTTIIQKEYAAFIDPETVPYAADFIAYLIGAVEPYFQN